MCLLWVGVAGNTYTSYFQKFPCRKVPAYTYKALYRRVHSCFASPCEPPAIISPAVFLEALCQVHRWYTEWPQLPLICVMCQSALLMHSMATTASNMHYVLWLVTRAGLNHTYENTACQTRRIKHGVQPAPYLEIPDPIHIHMATCGFWPTIYGPYSPYMDRNHRLWTVFTVYGLYMDRIWIVTAGGALQNWVQFPADAVPFALFGQLLFFLSLFLLSSSLASLSYKCMYLCGLSYWWVW
jgi:hypothetical protein